MSVCSNSWGNWRGGGPLLGAGGGGGIRQLPDMLNLPLAREAVLAADPGTYVDVYIGSAEFNTFICTVQHQVFGITPYARVIGPFYAKRLGSYANSVVDLTDSAELEVAIGSLGTWSGGLSTVGDVVLLYRFLGGAPGIFVPIWAELLIHDPASPVTAIDNSFWGVGLIDTSDPSKRTLGGGGYYLAGDRVQNALLLDTLVLKSTSSNNSIWQVPPMPTTPNKVTIETLLTVENNLTSIAISTKTKAHVGFNSVTRPQAFEAWTLTANANQWGAVVDTGASTLIDMVVEVISTAPLQIPAPGY